MKNFTAGMAKWLLVAALFAACSAQAADAPKFQVDPLWPKQLPNNWILGQVSGVAVDAQDNVWIIQRPRSLTNDEKGATLSPPRSTCCVPAPPVIEFDPAGNVIQSWGGPGAGYEWPTSEHGIYVDYKGFVWVGGNGPQDGLILKFTKDGKFVMQIGHEGPSKGSNDTTQLGRPADTVVDPATNELYVADGYGNHRVIVFDADTGAYKRHWGAYGKKPVDVAGPADPDGPAGEAERLAALQGNPEQFGNPVHCVKLAKDGLLYVCDRINNRVQVFHKDGTFVREWFFEKNTLGNGSVWDLGFSPDAKQTYLYNADGENNVVRELRRADGAVLSSFGHAGRAAGQFHWVHNMAVDSKGDVFTTEVDNAKRVQKFIPSP
jgi:DNA-binding beta-propeller fold protein YncE